MSVAGDKIIPPCSDREVPEERSNTEGGDDVPDCSPDGGDVTDMTDDREADVRIDPVPMDTGSETSDERGGKFASSEE